MTASTDLPAGFAVEDALDGRPRRRDGHRQRPVGERRGAGRPCPTQAAPP